MEYEENSQINKLTWTD